MKRAWVLFLILVVCLLAANTASNAHIPAHKLNVRGLWVHPGDAGHTEAEVAAFIDKAKAAHLNTIVLLVENAGSLYYSSRLFPEAVEQSYRSFDLLRAVITEAHKRDIKVHAWLTDFLESTNGVAYKQHPEWAQLNSDGKTTTSEMLGGGRPYPYVWMCPARRPGYVDQYLLPLIKEIVTNYEVDGIHHDYVRYPGDVNPDGYCFCDYCLNQIFTHSHLAYETAPHDISPERLLPRIDADLGREYTPKPPEWDHWTRRAKADFFLHGRYQYDSAPDMSYFFYIYRTDAIKTFVRETTELVKSIRPNAVISAAVFKNPETSGRFIGQRWSDWTEYVDEMMPMTYRSHFSTDWNTFLKEFGEYTRYQKKWAGNSHLDQGIATTYLYREMYDPINQANSAIDRWIAREGEGGAERMDILRLSQITASQLAAGPRKDEYLLALKNLPQTIVDADSSKAVLNARLIANKLIGDPPTGFLPPERLAETIRVAVENGADGIVLFSAGSINQAHLWEVIKEAF
jgi:uncharacterized lipoprotein YddW (UPF0748 family)